MSAAAPRLDVRSSLDFGLAAVVAGSGVLSTRALAIDNQGGPAGASPPLTTLEVDGATITPANSTTAIVEFRLGTPLPLTLDSGENAALRVELVAQSTGRKEAILTLNSNDPGRPAVSILLSAEVKAYGNCNLALNKNSLQFGVVYATSPMTRRLVIRNRSSTETCLAYAALSETTPSDYSLLATTPAELSPGEGLEIPVRFQPKLPVSSTPVVVTGVLKLEQSSVTTPSVAVPLDGAAGPACLALLAGEVHFGNVEANFGTLPSATTSQAIPVRVVNHCVCEPMNPGSISPLTLRGVRVVGDVSQFNCNSPLQFQPMISRFSTTASPAWCEMEGWLRIPCRSGSATRRKLKGFIVRPSSSTSSRTAGPDSKWCPSEATPT
jgi:hypothetical protein